MCTSFIVVYKAGIWGVETLNVARFMPSFGIALPVTPSSFGVFYRPFCPACVASVQSHPIPPHSPTSCLKSSWCCVQSSSQKFLPSLLACSAVTTETQTPRPNLWLRPRLSVTGPSDCNRRSSLWRDANGDHKPACRAEQHCRTTMSADAKAIVL